MLTKNMRHSVPGFGVGLVAFAAYVFYDQTMAGGNKGHH
jgi:hypothetical protein